MVGALVAKRLAPPSENSASRCAAGSVCWAPDIANLYTRKHLAEALRAQGKLTEAAQLDPAEKS